MDGSGDWLDSSITKEVLKVVFNERRRLYAQWVRLTPDEVVASQAEAKAYNKLIETIKEKTHKTTQELCAAAGLGSDQLAD